MTNQTRMTNARIPGFAGRACSAKLVAGERSRVGSAFGFRHSFVILASSVVIFAFSALGCASIPPAPSAYRLDLEQKGLWKTAQVGSIRASYVEEGSGFPVVLLHGFGGSAFDWRHLRPRLAQAGFRVITPDMLGAGYTEKPADLPYTIQEQARFVRELLALLGVERAVVGGNSYGGGVSLMLAIEYPDLVERLVLVDCLCFRHEMPWFVRAGRIPLLPTVAFYAVPPRIAAYRALALCYERDEEIETAVRDEYAHEFSFEGTRGALLEMLGDIVAGEPQQFEERLGKIRQPALILWGENDIVIPLELGQKLDRVLPDSRLEVIARSGHIPNQEDPDSVSQIVLEFLRDLRQGRP